MLSHEAEHKRPTSSNELYSKEKKTMNLSLFGQKTSLQVFLNVFKLFVNYCGTEILLICCMKHMKLV